MARIVEWRRDTELEKQLGGETDRTWSKYRDRNGYLEKTSHFYIWWFDVLWCHWLKTGQLGKEVGL